jgi:hypothetical protein
MSKHPKPKGHDELQRLLALKRHERPPQPFFARLADNVLHNLDAPERPETMSWLQRVGVHFDVSPAVVGGVGVLLAVLLAVGIVAAMKMDPIAADPLLKDPNGGPVGLNPVETAQPPSQPTKATEVPKSTAPVMAPDTSFNSQTEK